MEPFQFLLSASGIGPVKAEWHWPTADARAGETSARVMFGIHTEDKPRNPLPGVAWEQRFAYDPRIGLRRALPHAISRRRARTVCDALHVSALAWMWIAHETNLRLVDRLPDFEEHIVFALREQMVQDARSNDSRVRPIRLQGLRVRTCYAARQGWNESWANVRYDRLKHVVSVGLFDRDELFGKPLLERANAHWVARLPDLFVSAAASAREQILGRLPVLPPS